MFMVGSCFSRAERLVCATVSSPVWLPAWLENFQVERKGVLLTLTLGGRSRTYKGS